MTTLDEVINRLQVFREEMGGDTPFCRQKEETLTGTVRIFEPACVEVQNVIDTTTDKDEPEYVSVFNGNTSQIVVVF